MRRLTWRGRSGEGDASARIKDPPRSPLLFRRLLLLPPGLVDGEFLEPGRADDVGARLDGIIPAVAAEQRDDAVPAREGAPHRCRLVAVGGLFLRLLAQQPLLA